MRSLHQFTNNPSGRPITFVLDTVDPIGNAVANNQYRYSESHEIIFKILQPGDRVIDLGGHIGTFSLVAAALGCHVVAVEASPFNAELIKASIAENNFHNRFRRENHRSCHDGESAFSRFGLGYS